MADRRIKDFEMGMIPIVVQENIYYWLSQFQYANSLIPLEKELMEIIISPTLLVVSSA
ncbi:unnamed protein product [Sphenostylis stenocarpa]|uniref:Uncharacterized protein n=1 Tax=Sphenostylis stenocarpa TaxID=92480 RepID=A0AA86SZ86_9FABA|nr:unnamed protein product [Sphenostylis stenocarpa]